MVRACGQDRVFSREHPFSHQFSSRIRLSGGTSICFFSCQCLVLPLELPALLGRPKMAFIANRDVTEPNKEMIRGSWNSQCEMFN